MRFFILGPLTVLHNGQDITPSAPKVRQVLTFLLLRRNQLVQVSEFIDELWSSNPPDSAMTTLQTYIYKLRKDVLDPSGPARLHTQPSGYMLEVHDDRTDVYAFERLAAEGRRALERDDPAQATTLLSQALSLWRGKALMGVTTGEILSAHVTRLEEVRLRTLEMRIEADLRLGRHQELISELKQLVFTHPLHEGFHRDLMITLSRSGRRYEGLEVYRRLRDTLIDELGLEPSAPLQQLHQSLLGADVPAHDDDGRVPEYGSEASQAARAPGPVLLGVPVTRAEQPPGTGDAPSYAPPGDHGAAPGEVGGTGSENDRPSAHGPGPAGSRPGYPRTLMVPAQLPPDISDFVGRQAQIHRIRRWLSPAADRAPTRRTTARIVSISGMTGVGKTTLTLHAAHMETHGYPDGQLFADLRGASTEAADPADVLFDFLHAVGVPPREIPLSTEERSKLFRTWCHGRRVLIVLDDAASVSQVTPLLPASPGCSVLITSRFGLGGLPGAERLDMGTMTTAECVELLGRMIGADRIAAEPQHAETIVEQCGQLPLAVRSVGARLASMRTWPLAKMVSLLETDPAPLNQFHYAEYDLRASYESSYQHLDDRDRSTFRLLSLLPPDHFTATTVAGLLGVPTYDAETQLNRLVSCHLLQTDVRGSSDETYYFLHRLTRLYAKERLTREYIELTP